MAAKIMINIILLLGQPKSWLCSVTLVDWKEGLMEEFFASQAFSACVSVLFSCHIER